jgi:hypothetical protein
LSVSTTLPPPPTTTGAGGGGSEWIELVKARHDIDAHLLTGRLAEAGVETRTVADRGALGAWLYGGSNPWAPVTVLVRRRQLQDARLVLAEISLESTSQGRLEQGPARASLAWWVVALGLGVILSVVALGQVADVLQAGEGYGRRPVPGVRR